MKKKVKLLPAKEARELVEKQRLKINALENEVDSLELARKNCKDMLDYNQKRLEEKKKENEELRSTIRTQTQNLRVLMNSSAEDRDRLSEYRTESGLSLLQRGCEELFEAVYQGLANLGNKVKSLFQKN